MLKFILLTFVFSFSAFADCVERFKKYQNSPDLIFELISNAKQICEIKGRSHKDCKDILTKGHGTIDTFLNIGSSLEKDCSKKISPFEFQSVGYQLGVLKKNLNNI